jgi:hypothetical protein
MSVSFNELAENFHRASNGVARVMLITREDSRHSLIQLRLPAAVLANFDGRSPHPDLWYRCKDPYHIFAAPFEFNGDRITPLWECGITVTAYEHTLPGRFITFSLEDPTEIRVLGASFSPAVADLLIDLWEDENPDEVLREIAELFEFRQIEQLLLECNSLAHSADYDDWKRRFLQSCENID